MHDRPDKNTALSQRGQTHFVTKAISQVYEDWQAVLNLPSVIDELTDPIRI
jgi:hypothetical protein